MVKGKISLNKLEKIFFMHSELKEKCILNILSHQPWTKLQSHLTEAQGLRA